MHFTVERLRLPPPNLKPWEAQRSGGAVEVMACEGYVEADPRDREEARLGGGGR